MSEKMDIFINYELLKNKVLLLTKEELPKGIINIQATILDGTEISIPVQDHELANEIFNKIKKQNENASGKINE